MNDLFTQPGADFLRAEVRLDNQSFEFEWIPGESRWEAVEISGSRIHLTSRVMREIVSMPMNSLWANV